MSSLRERLSNPRDIASLAVFRMLVGALLFVSTLRFLANGWVDRFFAQPSYFFSYWGFEWVGGVSPLAMTAVHVVMAAAALGVALGLYYRLAAPVLFVTFSYVELIDVTNYLNHYYLVSLLTLLFCFMPLNGAYSLDARRDPGLRRDDVPAWMVYLLRLQIGVVYFYAGLAKAESDWLVHAQPLGIWLAARSEVPLIGSLVAIPEAAYVMSWAGFLNDLFAVPLLLNRRTRPYGFAMIVVFHVGTHLLFTIGVFPFLMPMAATLFFDTDWPRRLSSRLRGRFGRRAEDAAPTAAPPAAGAPRVLPVISRVGLGAVLAYAAFQVFMPLRAHLYDGSVLWHEQGMRYSWRVMLREKNGSVSYRVRARGWEHERVVSPSRYLTVHQEREMSGQPDMILHLAHDIAADYRGQGERDVEVRVDALVSLNGRPAAPMIDPEVDLTKIGDGVLAADWITPMPDGPPLSATARRRYADR